MRLPRVAVGGIGDRQLSWDGCHNVRDLGGLPIAAGGETRLGAVVRADSLRRLSVSGWTNALDYGVRRIVNLRFAEECARDPNADVPVDVVHVSLFGRH
ncbi:MAG: tyrosine-protein phosphatase, partial [Gaiellaceae bacterium]